MFNTREELQCKGQNPSSTSAGTILQILHCTRLQRKLSCERRRPHRGSTCDISESPGTHGTWESATMWGSKTKLQQGLGPSMFYSKLDIFERVSSWVFQEPDPQLGSLALAKYPHLGRGERREYCSTSCKGLQKWSNLVNCVQLQKSTLNLNRN